MAASSGEALIVALEGTIRDFGLGDIFQLIGIQRKSGLLTLDNGKEKVTVKFLEGNVVGADTKSRSVEDLLGTVLVRTGRITAAQLQEALKRQKKTLQRLGHVLVKAEFISEEDLVEALRVQSLQIVYRLFRWREGKYAFLTTDQLDYDDKHFHPISAETILMEGARMVDEWPIIERRIRSDRMLLRRTAAAELALSVESIVDADVDPDAHLDRVFGGQPGEAPERPAAPTVQCSEEEREVLSLVDGRRSVEEINDCSRLGEFDTYRILSDLLTRQLVEEIKAPRAPEAVGRLRELPARMLRAVAALALLLAAGTSLSTLRDNPFTPWRLARPEPVTAELRLYASQARLERIRRAVQVFYLDAGSFPGRLTTLTRHGYLDRRDLLDPWGRAYHFELGTGGYRLQGADGRGEPIPELTVHHRFTAAQRMMLERSELGAE